MAASGRSAWGSFLQQAVAGVEAHLDNILAEPDESESKPEPISESASNPSRQPTPSKGSATNRANDRLQQRLARAVATKSSPKLTPASSARGSFETTRKSSESQLSERPEENQLPEASASKLPAASPSDIAPENRRPECLPNNSEPALPSLVESKPTAPGSEAPTTVEQLNPPILLSSEPLPTGQPQTAPTTAFDNDDVVIRCASLKAEVDQLRSALSMRDGEIKDLNSKLRQRSGFVDRPRLGEDLEKSQKKIRELEESVALLEVEKKLVSDRANLQIQHLKSEAEKAADRARAVEAETRAELLAMESRLEAMRVRAEDVSSGPVEVSESKLQRQLETLQAQYTTATENWQGIETTLVSRISSLEDERDEALRRESDMRKKAREAAIKAKRQDQLDEPSTSPPKAEVVSALELEIEQLKVRAEKAEASLGAAQGEIEKLRNLVKDDRRENSELDRRNWLDDLPRSFRGSNRPESPQLTGTGPVSLPLRIPRTNTNDSLAVGPTQGGRLSGPNGAPPVSPLLISSPAISNSHGYFEATGSLGGDKDEFPEQIETSSRHHVTHDITSVSTSAAGPSVQLVERMSAAVRRLESEKVAAREELSRISNQRDEARSKIADLMREVEEGKQARARVTELEAQVEELNSRYQTTLVLLGEKSERVEELQADVEDVKAMYRDLVERTVR